MNFARKLTVLVLLAALALIPFQTVQAKGLLDGPIFGQNFTLKSGETLNEDLIVFGGSVTIEKGATVNGSIVLMGGSLKVDGEVMGDVSIIGGAASLGAEAHVHGNLSAVGAPVSRAEGAKVDGDFVNNPTRPATPELTTPPGVPFVQGVVSSALHGAEILGMSVLFGILAMVIVLLMPEHTRRVAEALSAKPLNALGMGLLSEAVVVPTIIALALLTVLFAVLVLTLPLVILTVLLMIVIPAAFVIALLFGLFAMGMELGTRFTRSINREWPLPIVAGLGTFVLYLLGSILGSFWFSWLIPFVVATFGAGAVFITRFGTRPLEITASQAPVESVPAPENV